MPFLPLLKLAWDFLAGLPWQLWVAIICLVAAFFGVRAYGDAQREDEARIWQAKIAAAQAKFAAKVKANEAKLTAAHRQIEIATANIKVVRVETTKTLIEKVPEYVTTFADSRCIVPVGLVQHHNAAASFVPIHTATTGELVDSDSGIALSRVEAVVTENYGIAHDWRIELNDCRARYTSAFESLTRFNLQPTKGALP